jgi:hypothetical protein
MPGRPRSHLRAAFTRLNPAGKVAVATIGPVCTVIGTLLALNIIHPAGQDALAAAARHTQATTASIVIRFASTGGSGAPVAFDAHGRYDLAGGRAILHYDVDAAAAGGNALNDVEVRIAGHQAYLRLAGPLATARRWVHADLATARQQIADYAAAAGVTRTPPEFSSLTELDLADPSTVLSELQRAGHVQALGHRLLFGVPVDTYRATLAPRHREGHLEATASIDDQQLVRRLALRTTDGPAPFRMTLDFTRFGGPVPVPAPPASRTSELRDVLDRLLG